MVALLHEIQAADMLGYRTAEEFRRDLRRGIIPPPTRIIHGRNRWSEEALRAWINGEDKDGAEIDPVKALEKIA